MVRRTQCLAERRSWGFCESRHPVLMAETGSAMLKRDDCGDADVALRATSRTNSIYLPTAGKYVRRRTEEAAS